MRWYLMRDSAYRLFSLVLAATLTAISPVVVAEQAPQDTHALDEIVVVGVTPVPGFKVDRDKIPGNIQTLRSSDLTRNGAANVLGLVSKRHMELHRAVQFIFASTGRPLYSSANVRFRFSILGMSLMAI
jgi:hypothetical protein